MLCLNLFELCKSKELQVVTTPGLQWCKAINMPSGSPCYLKRFVPLINGLCDQGVFAHDWPTEILAKAGIVGKPVPCSVALTHTYKDGNLEKLKTRICVAGYRRNVTQGIHYPLS